MTPPLAQTEVFACETARVDSRPSVATDWYTKWKLSATSHMSPPPPWTVQVPLVSD